MVEIFETFRPKDVLIARFVSYYYLDIKPNNVVTEFECFPHYNNTISLYKSHTRTAFGEIKFMESVEPLQIFTPVREKVLHVNQIGKVHRVVIVFNILGVQQFYRDKDFSAYITDFAFFSDNELRHLFSLTNKNEIIALLDSALLYRFKEFKHVLLSKSVKLIFRNSEKMSVEQLANQLGVSRKHLNRVFKINLGISLKKFQEIVVFRHTIEKKLFVFPEESFTQLAYEFNFSDQAHLNKYFQNFTQNSPSKFLKKGTLLGEQNIFWHLIRKAT